MTPDKKLHVHPQGDREMVMSRAFAAPKELVFDAYTKPELLVRWLGAMDGWKLEVCEVDLREGGAYRWVWRNAERGQEMGCGGVYREVSAPHRLVCTEKYDEPWYEGEALNTVTFVERDGITTLTQTVRYESTAVRDKVIGAGVTDGVEAGYAVLEQVLASLR